MAHILNCQILLRIIAINHAALDSMVAARFDICAHMLMPQREWIADELEPHTHPT